MHRFIRCIQNTEWEAAPFTTASTVSAGPHLRARRPEVLGRRSTIGCIINGLEERGNKQDGRKQEGAIEERWKQKERLSRQM